MIAAGATTLAPVLGRMVSNPAGGPRPPSASKGSTSSSESCLPYADMIDMATVSDALLGTIEACAACLCCDCYFAWHLTALIATACRRAIIVCRLIMSEQLPEPQAKGFLARCHNFTTSGVPLMSHGLCTKPEACSLKRLALQVLKGVHPSCLCHAQNHVSFGLRSIDRLVV
jgi:uncharacterized protein (DUF779 family)